MDMPPFDSDVAGNGRPRSLARRGLLLSGAAVGGGLLVGCSAPSAFKRLGDPSVFAPAADEVALNGWVKITPDDRVIVAVPRAEMGQGVYTALAMLVAEELEADWSQVSVEQAPVARIYANTALLLNILPFESDDDGLLARLARSTVQALGYALSLQVTGGSSSVRDAWEPMRLVGATARVRLVDAAAQAWKVPAAECSVRQGVVTHAASGRILRFGALARAASTLAAPEELRLKPPGEFRLIGTRVPRLDTPDKVNGEAQFGIDVQLPGLLHAAIRHCPVPGGRLRRFDDSRARQRPGVRDVLALGDQAVVALAEGTWAAQSALDQVDIVWDDGPNAKLSSADISAQLWRDLEERRGSGFRSQGNVDAGLAASARRIDARYEVPFLAHAALEPINCTAQVRDGRVTVWCGTQVPSFARQRAGKVAGVPTEQVELHVPYLGGGFGRRLELDMIDEAVGLAMRTGGLPVKLTWSREEDMQHDMYRPAAVANFSAGLDADGKVVAWRNRVSAPSVGLGTMERLMPSLAMDMPDKNHIEGAFDLPYAIEHVNVRQIRSKTPIPVGSWRSVGHSYNAFFVESFADEVAHAAGQDPVAWRLALLEHHPRHRAVLAKAAERAGWGTPPPQGRARGVALHESFGSICAQVAEVSIVDGAPRVHRVVCVIDCGVVVNPDTVEAQMHGAIVYGLSAALYGEITVRDGRIEQSNFGDYRMLSLGDMPDIEVIALPGSDWPGGVGEPGTPPIAPAVANALFALTGKRLRRLPLQLEA